MSVDTKVESSSGPMPPLVRTGWWLLVVGFAMQAVVGYTIAFAIETPLWSWHQDAVGLALWDEASFGPRVAAYRAWAMAVVGSTITSWAVVMLWVVVIPLRRRQRWAWWAIATSTLVWFLVDTAVSAAQGVTINVYFNLGVFVMIAGPLAMTWPWREPAAGE